MSRKRLNIADPTANAAIGNITREGKLRAPQQQKARRKIVDEFPDIFRGLNEAQKVTITLAAAKLAGHDAWAINAEHLEKAKVDYFRRSAGRSTR